MSSVPLFANERIATCETPAAVPALHNSVGRLEAEPVVKDENGRDRRNDEAKYDAPAPTERNEKMDLDELRWILDVHLEDLPPQQHEVVVQTFTEGRKRPEVAARLGISVHTYDNHLQAAFRTMRDSMKTCVEISSDAGRPLWYDRIEEVIERRDARERLRPSSKKGKRSRSEGEGGKSEGERGEFEGERAKAGGGGDTIARAAANVTRRPRVKRRRTDLGNTRTP